MEQTANALPPVTLGQYKGLPVTRCPGDAGHAGF